MEYGICDVGGEWFVCSIEDGEIVDKISGPFVTTDEAADSLDHLALEGVI
jgi:hypothetical protein